ncbi:MAG: hypothetical protein ACT4OZ_10035 [Gemmatimonadota bacterium]
MFADLPARMLADGPDRMLADPQFSSDDSGMKTILLPIALLAAAVPFRATAQRVLVSIPGIQGPIQMDTVGTPVAIAAPVARAWHAAMLAFEELKVPARTADSARGLVANLDLVQSRRLGGSNLSRYLSCGSTMTGLRADSYRLTMPIAVFLSAASPEQTRVRVALVASARDMSGPSTEPVPCQSTGALEDRIVKAIQGHIAASAR